MRLGEQTGTSTGVVLLQFGDAADTAREDGVD
jgi:hypothetical protein